MALNLKYYYMYRLLNRVKDTVLYGGIAMSMKRKHKELIIKIIIIIILIVFIVPLIGLNMFLQK